MKNPLERKMLFGWAMLGGAIAFSMLTVTPTAHADLPRPPGWEPTCTLEKELQKGGGPCEQARGYQDPDPRQAAFAAKGYTLRCTEGGAASYIAVWCQSAAGGAKPAEPAATATATTTAAPTATNPSPTPPPVAPAPDNRRGSGICSVNAIGQDKQDAQAWSLLVVALSLGLALRKKRASL